jgi:hypothetical protein
MDILAPGANILSVDITNGSPRSGMGITSGTSMSVPYVTAAAVMMLAIDPTLGAEEIREILAETAYVEGVDCPAGDMNLVAALDEVLFRTKDDTVYDYDNRESEKKYRQMLKEKIRDARRSAVADDRFTEDGGQEEGMTYLDQLKEEIRAARKSAFSMGSAR